MAALDYLKQRGLSAKQNGNKLMVVPKELITPVDRAFIKLHRTEILAELAANDGVEQRLHWNVHLNGKHICVITGGPMTAETASQHARFRWPKAEIQI